MREVGGEGEEGIYVVGGDGKGRYTCGLWAGCFGSAQHSRWQASLYFFGNLVFTPLKNLKFILVFNS